MREILSSFKAQQLVSKYIQVPKSQFVKQLWQVKMNLPLVLKISSGQIIHKTEIKAVRIVRTPAELRNNFLDLQRIIKRKKIKADGILVQEYCEGQEFIIGIKKDPVFNHVILFGLGGILAEILNDSSVRKCPVTILDANEMIHEIRARKIFDNLRGRKLNENALKQAILKLSEFSKKNKNIAQLDINPYILNEKSGKAADVRIVLG